MNAEGEVVRKCAVAVEDLQEVNFSALTNIAYTNLMLVFSRALLETRV